MAAFLLFFGMGLAEFTAQALCRTRSPRFRFWMVCGAGFLAGALMAFLPVRIPTPGFRIPGAVFPLIGAASGGLITAAEHKAVFRRPLLQFFATPLISLVLAAVLGLCLMPFVVAGNPQSPIKTLLSPVGLAALLMAFMTVFGYTFPRRWFQRYLE